VTSTPYYHSEDSIEKERQQTKVRSTKVSVDQYRKFKSLAEYLYQKGLANDHTPSAVLRNQIVDLLSYYCSEVDDSFDRSKDQNNITHPKTSMFSPSLVEEGQEYQEDVTQHHPSESEPDDMLQYIRDFVLEEIISRYGAKKNYDIVSEGRLQMLSRANEMSLRISVDFRKEVDDLAIRSKAIIDAFDRIY
jgi:DNA-binding ferritin-like protein (Dps family)